MNLNHLLDDDSDQQSDFADVLGEDIDVHLNHYRVPKLSNYGYGGLGLSSPPNSRGFREQMKCCNEGKIMTLAELAAQKVACHLPFGLVERYRPPVPEPMQCRIAFWSFPQDEEDVKLYTCLANGNADYFYRAEELINQNAVRDILQVGFHLSANVELMSDSESIEFFRVAVTFDRRRITSCSCTCMTSTFWCQHVVAVCLQRIRNPQEIKIRAPVSESLQRLEKNQLQKFAQYLINEMPQQILPAAQKLLDELLSGDEASINLNPGAPDPTAGATINEHTSWCLDYTHLSLDIHRILLKQCTAQPTVCGDIQSLHVTAPPATTEYQQLLRPIRGREPEGIWNLISIVGEMMKRRDPNLFLLLEIMTDVVMKFDKIVTWWFETKVSLHSGSSIHFSNTKTSQSTSQYSSSNFCDEIVRLWRLASLNPSASQAERQELSAKFFTWHLAILKKHSSLVDGGPAILENTNGGAQAGAPLGGLQSASRRNLLELFPGFKPAIEGCQTDWADWDEKSARLMSIVEPENSCEPGEKPSRRRKRRSKAKQRANRANKADSEEVQAPLTETNTQELDNLEVNHDSASHVHDEKDANDESVDLQQQQSQDQGEADPEEGQCPDENDEGQGNEQRSADHAPSGVDSGSATPRRPLPAPGGVRMLRQQNGLEEDLQVYFMDRQQDNGPRVSGGENLEDLIRVNPKRLADPIESLYAKTEGLHAHGHLEEARRVARHLATEILNQRMYPTPRQLFILSRRKKKKGSLDNQMTIVSSEALSKINFLCQVLMEDQENHGLIFRLVMFGVALKRAPAATRPLEVKLISQKQELITLLKSITMHDKEFEYIRNKARTIRDAAPEDSTAAMSAATETSTSAASATAMTADPLTTLILGNYFFEALVLSRVSTGRLPEDAELGFQCALAAIGQKIDIPEIDHPLLCEGIRRQRGELALSLISHHKDDQEKLDAILKQLLDKDLVKAKPTVERSPTNTITSNSGQATSCETTGAVAGTPASTNGAASVNGNVNVAVGSGTLNKRQDLNQPSEAAAHFMFELAKTVYDKAGGNSNTAHLFRPQLVTQNGARGIHRKLHMCALRIALHSIGLQNRTQTNWMQRTYNGRASFVHEQALELGLPGIKFLCENWEGYLTPVEAALIADKAGCSSDADTKRIAAEMAKSCLRYANYLDFNYVGRILAQCKEQTVEMFEEACSEIEQLAEDDSVCANVLFATARAWHRLYLDLITDERHSANENLYQLTSSDHQDTGAGDWLATSGQPHIVDTNQHQHQQQQQRQQLLDVVCPPMWDVYARSEFMLTRDTPTYKNFVYVRAAFRVGIKALDSLRLSLHAVSKHNPKMRDEILWLLQISKSLGRDCFYIFSSSVVRNILDPYILHLIIHEIIEFFEVIKLPENHIDRVNILVPIYDKCLDRCLRQTKDLLKHMPYESGIETILEVMKNLTSVTKTITTAQHYWEMLRFLEHKLGKRNNRRSKLYVNLAERRQWLENFARDDLNCCACNDCWKKRGLPQESRFRYLYQ